ncbi:putative RNA methyltransferase [Paenibacillus lentus]|nr:methyltransferase domain-containing protein [Paenibacillus lentus]
MLKFHNMPENMVICPVCAATLRLQGRSLICRKSHCFDIAKQGYVNFLLQAPKEKYDKYLFQSRARISEAGVFKGITDRLSTIVLLALEQQSKVQQIANQQNAEPERAELQCTEQQSTEQQKLLRSNEAGQRCIVKVLDAGCGEGSHLYAVKRKLVEAMGSRLSLVATGIDLAKEGIKIAAKRSPEMMWGVADLAKCPFADHSFDIILNILSPANYAEFQRMLAPAGSVIKVIPGKEYLQEIRQALYEKSDRRVYSNDRTITLFRRHFRLEGTERIKYEVTLDGEPLMQLLQMTPLAWQASRVQMQQVAKAIEGRAITFDFDILTGRNKLN